ncbi:MAG: SCO family protein [Myxococcaceae bacterium]
MKWLSLALVLLAVPAFAAPKEDADAKNVLALDTKWTLEDGSTISLSSLKGRWTVLTFVYTSCAGTCPLTTKKLKRLDAALEKAGKVRDIVVVSLDPAHDTPDAVKAWRERYGLLEAKRWKVLVGAESQLRTLTMLLEFKYTRNADSGAILHDNTVFLVGPDGTVRAQMSSLDQPMDEFVSAVPAS